MGGQITRYGLGDNFQSDLSFSVNSIHLDLVAANLSKNIQLNIGYFFTSYTDYDKSSANYNGTGVAGSDVFSRTKVFAAGIDFSFLKLKCLFIKSIYSSVSLMNRCFLHLRRH